MDSGDRNENDKPTRRARLAARATYANVMATVAFFFAISGGTAWAVNEWTGANIVDESLTGADVRGKAGTTTTPGVNGSLTGLDISGQPANATTGQLYVNGSLTTWDVADDSLRGLDVLESSLGKVPNSDKVDGLDSTAFLRNGAAAGGDLSGTYPNPQLAAPEAWHEVGTAGEPPFAVYSGGIGTVWDNFDTGHSSVAFFKDRQGVVHFKGVARRIGGELCGGVLYVFFLPPGYKPARRSVFTTLRNGALGRINVDADGGVMMDASVGGVCSPNGEWLSLEGITFRAV